MKWAHKLYALMPGKAAFTMVDDRAELNICCAVFYGCDYPFEIKICDEKGRIRTTHTVRAWKNARFLLKPDAYTIKIRNSCGLNPRGVTKWVRIFSNTQYDFCFYFTPVMSLVELVPVDFTVCDANYPGILKMNGGIKVWRNKTIR